MPTDVKNETPTKPPKRIDGVDTLDGFEAHRYSAPPSAAALIQIQLIPPSAAAWVQLYVAAARPERSARIFQVGISLTRAARATTICAQTAAVRTSTISGPAGESRAEYNNLLLVSPLEAGDARTEFENDRGTAETRLGDGMMARSPADGYSSVPGGSGDERTSQRPTPVTEAAALILRSPSDRILMLERA